MKSDADFIKQLFPNASQSTLRRNLAQVTESRNMVLAHLAQVTESRKQTNVAVQEPSETSKLNKTEAAYWAHMQSKGYKWLGLQNVTFKLGHDCRYTPDMMCLTAEGQLEAHEVKGFFRDDAKVKIKVAARLFPFIKFIVVQKQQYNWTFTPVNP